ncbi:MAG TPA: hypothetical protein VFA78_09380 [Chloroflexota bacterium]|nr:hypothetical protein [Chloroflexota bacterium]
MSTAQSDELVFTVSGASATPVDQIAIETLGLTERAHLQEWVICHPEIIDRGVLIISVEFDQWMSAGGAAPRDRLDILALGQDGRLVICELKRGLAPDTVELQAIKYAAMASRFTEQQLADLHAEFLRRTGQGNLTTDESLEVLQNHAASGLFPDLLMQPRIVLLARDFSSTVTSSVVWLNEQGVEITLKRYRAYRTSSNETVVTISQYYPVLEVASFEVAPRLRARNARTITDLPEVAWSAEDLELLASLSFEVPHAVLDLCSRCPDEWVRCSDVYESVNVERASGKAKLAVFTRALATRFHRRNHPWQYKWAAGDVKEMHYRLDSETAELWRTIRTRLASTVSIEV